MKKQNVNWNSKNQDKVNSKPSFWCHLSTFKVLTYSYPRIFYFLYFVLLSAYHFLKWFSVLWNIYSVGLVPVLFWYSNFFRICSSSKNVGKWSLWMLLFWWINTLRAYSRKNEKESLGFSGTASSASVYLCSLF